MSYCDNNNLLSDKLRVRLEAERNLPKKNETAVNNRRGRFIVLGSSGECLPVTRGGEGGSSYSSCQSSEEEFHSAKTSLDDGKSAVTSFNVN